MKLSCHNQLDWVWFVIKTRQDKDMIDYIGLVYAKNDTELSGPIRPSMVSDETTRTTM